MTKLYRQTYVDMISGRFSHIDLYFDSDEDAIKDYLLKAQFPLQISRLTVVETGPQGQYMLDVKLTGKSSLPDITITERDVPNPNCPISKDKKSIF